MLPFSGSLAPSFTHTFTNRYSAQLVRRTMAAFYVQFMVDSFKRQMKENRKIEELILMFATHATGSLKKEPSLQGDGWKLELNNQIFLFVKVLQDCLRSISHVSPELHSRLDTYASKLAPSQTSNDSGYESSSTSHHDSVVPQVHASGIADMSLAATVTKLFRASDQTAQKEIEQLRPICTDKVVYFHCCTVAHALYAHLFPAGSPDRFQGWFSLSQA
jgi:hypothetical protein